MKNNYSLGIIGGIIGGIIASIPWILLYIYGNMMFSLLAIFIAMGAFYGYKLLGGKVNKKLPLIITVLSLFSVSTTTLIIIPLLLLSKNGLEASFENLEWLYQNSEFTNAMIWDYIISVVFTFLGISGVISKLKKGENPKIFYKDTLLQQESAEQIATIKEAFQKLNAMKKENAVPKEDVLNTLSDDTSTVFRTLCAQKIIRKYKKNYYFDEKSESSVLRRFFLIYFSILKWIILIFIILLIPILFL